jgi:DeoR family transcriptional regulator, fructose operon transcriptional repressor
MDWDKRKKYILHALDREGSVSVQNLSRNLDVSQMTVRRDLSTLEYKGFLIRRYGGAVKSEVLETLFSFEKRNEKNSRKKEEVCELGADNIEEGDTVFIDCGTTLFRLCRHVIAYRRLRVITNSLPVVSELLPYGHIQVTLVGGELLHERKAVYGKIAEKTLSELHACKAFIGTDGISIKNGLSSYDEKEGNISRIMAENAETVFLLCDSSKVEYNSYVRTGPLELIDFLVTDTDIDPVTLNIYKNHGITTITKRS